MATPSVKLTTPPADQPYDPLDMNNYSLNKLPKRPMGALGRFFYAWGLPLAAVIFYLTAYVLDFAILDDRQQVMFVLFVTALFLWISETVPNYGIVRK